MTENKCSCDYCDPSKDSQERESNAVDQNVLDAETFLAMRTYRQEVASARVDKEEMNAHLAHMRKCAAEQTDSLGRIANAVERYVLAKVG